MRNELYDTRTLDQYPVDDDQDGKFSSLDGADTSTDESGEASDYDDAENTDADDGETEAVDQAGAEAATPSADEQPEDLTPPPPNKTYRWPGANPGGVEAPATGE